MNNELHNIFNMMRSVRLTGHEKRAIRAALVRRMRMGAATRPTHSVFFGLRIRPRVILVGSMIGALLAGSTISYAAEGALPGDVLYSVKVSINEPVRVAFASTPYAKAALEVEFTDRRLQEAEQLALDGRLTTQTKMSLETHMNDHVDRAESYTAMIEADGDTTESSQVASDMEATLSAHQQVLIAIAQQVPEKDKQENLSELAVAVNARTHRNVSVMTVRKNDESPGATSLGDSIAIAQKNAQEKKEQATAGIMAAQAVVAEGAFSDENSAASRALTSATQKVSEGGKQLEDGNYDEALRSFYEGVKFTKEAQNIKKLERKFNVRVGVAVFGDDEDVSPPIVNITIPGVSEETSVATSTKSEGETGASSSTSESTPSSGGIKTEDKTREELEVEITPGDNFFAPEGISLR